MVQIEHNTVHFIVHFLVIPGTLCNRECPDKLLLSGLTSNNWHLGVKIFIVVVIIGISITCVIIKLLFALWLYVMEKKLNDYLHLLYKMGSPKVKVRSLTVSGTWGAKLQIFFFLKGTCSLVQIIVQLSNSSCHLTDVTCSYISLKVENKIWNLVAKV